MQHDNRHSLGRLVSAHATAAVHVQRAAVVAVLSLVFFLIMLTMFLLRGHFGYFLLATAFLVVNIFTILGWWFQKRRVLRVRENGLSYGRFECRWDEITAIDEEPSDGVKIFAGDKRAATIPRNIDRMEHVMAYIHSKIPKGLDNDIA